MRKRLDGVEIDDDDTLIHILKDCDNKNGFDTLDLE